MNIESLNFLRDAVATGSLYDSSSVGDCVHKIKDLIDLIDEISNVCQTVEDAGDGLMQIAKMVGRPIMSESEKRKLQ